MSVVAKLINPTPFKVKIPYERGVYITINPDDEVNLSMQQLDDFRPGKPGSEETRKILEFEGVFLQDSDLSYDIQALRALKTAVKHRSDRVKDFVERMRVNRTQSGVATDEKTIEEIKESAGYGRMERDVEKLKARVATLSQIVNEDENKGSTKQTLDPKRTCFVISPPRQFPSETALKMFLAENPEIAAKHNAMLEVATSEES